MPRVDADRAIMWSVIGIVAWTVLGLPLFQAISWSQGEPAQQPAAEYAPSEAKGEEPWFTKDAAGFFTFWLVVVGGLQLGLFYWQLRYMREGMADATIAAKAATKSADAAERSTNIANRTLIESHRPWIDVFEVSVGDLAFDEQGARITVIARMKNIGVAPAINVRLGVFAHLGIDIIAPQKEFCEEVRQWVGTGGPVLFPGPATTQQTSIPITESDIEKFGFAAPGDARKFITPIIAGCVDYTLALDGSHRQTRFAFMLSEIKNGIPHVIMPDMGNVPADRLRLTPWIGGGFEAD